MNKLPNLKFSTWMSLVYHYKRQERLNIQHDILSALAYFDLFGYPLKKDEIFSFLPGSYSLGSFNGALTGLVNRSIVFALEDFYSLRSDLQLLYRRKQGNKKAWELILKAKKIACFLSKFPYVRGVGVSGSLSKEFADDKSDIDFFIITRKDRLWIARTIMHCFKKLTFLVNRQHCFCMNYYIDEAMLEIREKNVYTATEVVTLMPCEGRAAFNSFYAANSWTHSLLPNHSLKAGNIHDSRRSIPQALVEAAFDNAAGDRLDAFLMNATSRRWSGKTKREKLNKRGIVMSMHATRHFAKPYPGFFQDKLLQLYTVKCEEIIQRYESSLHAHPSNT